MSQNQQVSSGRLLSAPAVRRRQMTRTRFLEHLERRVLLSSVTFYPASGTYGVDGTSDTSVQTQHYANFTYTNLNSPADPAGPGATSTSTESNAGASATTSATDSTIATSLSLHITGQVQAVSSSSLPPGPDAESWYASVLSDAYLGAEKYSYNAIVVTAPSTFLVSGSVNVAATAVNPSDSIANWNTASAVFSLYDENGLDVLNSNALQPALMASTTVGNTNNVPSATVNQSVTLQPGQYYIQLSLSIGASSEGQSEYTGGAPIFEGNAQGTASATADITITAQGAAPKPQITGVIEDADGNPLHGVRITAGSKTAYSDYAYASGGLPGAFDNVINGSFNIPFAQGATLPATVTFYAQDLAGNAYVKTVSVPSNGTVGTVELDSAGDAFHVIDAQDNIHLLADLAQSSSSDIVKRRTTTDPIASSARYEQEVQAVTEKLASLGFRQDNGSGTASGQDASPLSAINSWTAKSATTPGPAERADILFQDLSFAAGSSGVFKRALNGTFAMGVNGKVNLKTLNALNSLTGEVWLLDDDTAKAQAANTFVYESDNGNRWMNAAMVQKLSVLSGILSSKSITGLTLNSDSAATGGRANVPQGQSHATGSETDVSWVTRSGGAGQGSFYQAIPGMTPTVNSAGVPALSEEGITWNPVPTYSRKLTRQLIESILTSDGPTVNQVLFNDPNFLDPTSKQFINSALLTGFSGHADHIHFGVVVPALTGVELDAETSGAPPFPPS